MALETRAESSLGLDTEHGTILPGRHYRVEFKAPHFRFVLEPSVGPPQATALVSAVGQERDYQQTNKKTDRRVRKTQSNK